MKRIAYMLLLLSVIFFCSCGANSKPADITQQVYDYGVSCLNKIDDYINMDVSDTDCYVFIKEVYRRMDALSTTQDDKSLVNLVEMSFTVIDNYYTKKFTNENNFKEVMETRNKLAEQLNKPLK